MSNAHVLAGKYRQLGYVQDTSIAASSALPSIPEGARLALIQVTAQNARWRPDGSTTAPTATVGMQLTAGSTLSYSGDLSTFRIIEEAASAVLNVSYFA